MVLYISNPSKQNAEFHFRVGVTRDNSGPQAVVIRSGEQVPIGHGWTAEQQAYVIQQLESQGGGNAALAHGRMRRFSGLLYREDDAVDEDEIVTAHDAVVETQEERSATQATRSALAFDRVVNKNQKKGGGRQAKTTTVEIIEEHTPQHHRTGDEVEFSLTVDPDGRADVKLPGM